MSESEITKYYTICEQIKDENAIAFMVNKKTIYGYFYRTNGIPNKCVELLEKYGYVRFRTDNKDRLSKFKPFYIEIKGCINNIPQIADIVKCNCYIYKQDFTIFDIARYQQPDTVPQAILNKFSDYDNLCKTMMGKIEMLESYNDLLSNKLEMFSKAINDCCLQCKNTNTSMLTLYTTLSNRIDIIDRKTSSQSSTQFITPVQPIIDHTSQSITTQSNQPQQTLIQNSKQLSESTDDDKGSISSSDDEIQQKKSKGKRKSIPKKVKEDVWNTHIGDSKGSAKCKCCNVTIITQLSFDCGHIISHANGGTTTVSNLLPICRSCNLSMGTQNLFEFKKQFLS